jgi:hypothetical protein
MIYCNILAILVAIIKLKYLKKRQILEIQIVECLSVKQNKTTTKNATSFIFI